MFQSNSFAATLALCFSSVSATTFAADSVQLDVYRGTPNMARHLKEKWKSLERRYYDDNDAVQLQATLVPIDEKDDRIFVVWSGVQHNLPPSKSLRKFHDDMAPNFSISLSPTAFSPNNWDSVELGEVLELRTYVLTDGNLDAIHERFRDHTIKLFERHKIKNVEYYQLVDDQNTTIADVLTAFSPLGQDSSGARPNQNARQLTLMYFLAHGSKDEAASSFAAFRTDPEWIAAKTASEERAGGSLTVPNGVKSLLLRWAR